MSQGVRAPVRAFFREAFVGDERLLPRGRVRFAVTAAALSFAAMAGYLSLARHQTFHGRTFDLAFYARMAWGAANFDGWNPIVNASAYGLHLVWINHVLGPLGTVLGTVPVLLVAQAMALGLCALPLARIGARHLGPNGALVGAAAILLHPNLSHAGVSDFHPGSLAVLPLAWLMDALDRRSWQGVMLASLAVLLCREDLALVTAAAAVVLGVRARGSARAVGAAASIASASLTYVAFFVLVLLPAYGPPAGSLDAHFGHWGASVPEVLGHLAMHPGELARHLGEPARLAYLPMIAAPLAFLPFLTPELVVVAAPLLGICLLSRFPTTTFLDSHYLTPALPILVTAALVGAGRARRWMSAPGVPLAVCATLAHLAGGAGPLSWRFDSRAYADDADTPALRAMVELVGPSASVQAPDRMLAHLADRVVVRRGPPPETGTDFVLLDASHRRRFLHDEDVLRADEEPLVRDWLAREDHALVRAGGAHLLLRRGAEPRGGIGFERSVLAGSDAAAGRALTACLALRSATLSDTPRELVLVLVARGACPSDLALRIGVGYRPRRVDFLAGGLVSPAHLRAGDVVTSHHELSDAELRALAVRTLRVGAVRESGARPAPDDPVALDVPLVR